jgi:deoxyinosine 3'endonuclease (endonuclease V)
MEATVRALSTPGDVLLLDATAHDHPREAGLALHVGVELGLPTVGITDRPLLAQGSGPKTVAATSARSVSETPWSAAGCGRVPGSARWSRIRDGGSISLPQ